MDENKNEQPNEDVEDVTPEAELTEVTDWEAEAKKARAIAQRLRTKLTKATEKKVVVEPVKNEPKAGELDTAAYAYLAAKGIEDDEDIDFIKNRMNKWDMSLREVLKDEDVKEKLKGMKIEREVRKATPSATKRTDSGGINNVDYWIAKYDQTGELPPDFDLRTAVIDAKVKRESPNTPPWRR